MLYVSETFEPPPLVSSAALAWQGVRVEQYQLGIGELPAHHHAHHLLILYQGPTPVVIRHHRATGFEESVHHLGDLGLYPSGEYGTVAWNAPSENIYLTVDDQYLARIAQQGLDLARFALREQLLFQDPLLSQLSRQLLAAVESHHALGLLYVESLLNALCHQLIAHHATHERRIAAGGRLTGAVLARIEAYLEAYAEQPVTLETLAGLANLSVFHFARLFKQTTGVSPYQYVLSWKIRRARQLLRGDGAPVAAISDALGFASPASFSTAFKRAVGRSPQEFQRGD